MDLGETIRRKVHEAVDAALRAVPGDASEGPTGATTFASATNVSTSGHSVSVYVDDEVTIVERDGKRRVIRHDDHEDYHAEDHDAGGERPTE